MDAFAVGLRRIREIMTSRSGRRKTSAALDFYNSAIILPTGPNPEC